MSPKRAGRGVRHSDCRHDTTERSRWAAGVRKVIALAVIGVCGLATAGAEGCQGPPGAPDENDGYRPTITKMQHQPKDWPRRECWAIWYHNPYNNKVVKHCAEAKTYRKYKVGMEYHG